MSPTAVYRFYAADGALLYVGISLTLGTRIDAHRHQKPDWCQVVRIELTWHDSREGALAAEAAAIRTENPRWNVYGPGRLPRAPVAKGRTKAVVDDITGKIRGGEWPRGHRLPPDRALREHYGVSQMTIRTAMERLSGCVESQQGVGRFVKQ